MCFTGDFGYPQTWPFPQNESKQQETNLPIHLAKTVIQYHEMGKKVPTIRWKSPEGSKNKLLHSEILITVL